MRPWLLVAAFSLLGCDRGAAVAPASRDATPGAVAVPVETPAPASTSTTAVADPAVAEPAAAVVAASSAVGLHPTRAEAGATRCIAGAAVELGPHTMRRSQTVGPADRERSNLQIARIGAALVAVWPGGEDSLRLQPLADDGTPRGAATTLAAEGAPALFSLVPHGREPLALLRLHRRCHRDNGARCIDAWWITASGAPAGGKLEEFLGHNNSLASDAAIPASDGVLAAKTFDDTRQGYRYFSCQEEDDEGAPGPECPIVMPSPSLDLYTVGAAGAVVVSPLLAIAEKAQWDVFVPIEAEGLRGGLHLAKDRAGKRQDLLRLVGRAPVAFAGLDDIQRHGALLVHVNPRASTLEIVEYSDYAGSPGRLRRYRLDGTLLAAPVALGPGAQPFSDLIVGRLRGDKRAIEVRRHLLDGTSVGEPLRLASATRDIVRFATMSAMIWDRGRYVALHAVPARKGWTVNSRTITCTP